MMAQYQKENISIPELLVVGEAIDALQESVSGLMMKHPCVRQESFHCLGNGYGNKACWLKTADIIEGIELQILREEARSNAVARIKAALPEDAKTLGIE